MKHFLTTQQQEALSRADMSIEKLNSTILVGTVGSGKTTILDAIAHNSNSKVWTKSELVSLFSSRGYQGLDDVINSESLILDDIESKVQVSSFGEKCENLYEHIIKTKLDKMMTINAHYSKVVQEIDFLKTQKDDYDEEEYKSVMSSREFARSNWEKAMKARVFISTNMDIEDMKSNFSNALVDRMRTQMKTVFLVESESFRLA